MKSAHKLILSFILIVAVGFTASEGNALHDLFKSIDLNNDGKVEKNEFSNDMKKTAFDRLDADKDTELTASEWEQLDYEVDMDMHRDVFKKMDKDKDKRISFFEFSDYADDHSNIERAFMTLDKDLDSALSPDEISVRPLFRMITIRF